MADRRRPTRGIVLVGLLAGAAGAGVWWFRRRPDGRPLTDQWAVATAPPARPVAPPVPSEPEVPAELPATTVPPATTEPEVPTEPAVPTEPEAPTEPDVPVEPEARAEPSPESSDPDPSTPEAPAAAADSTDEAPKPSDMPATSSVEPVGAVVEDDAADPARPATLFDATIPSTAPGFTPSPAPRAAPTDDTPTVAIPAVNPAEPYGPGSAAPLADGSAPGPEYTIKGNASSMLFHPPSSPYFRRTKPEAWFRTAEDAEKAGFTEWKPKPRAT